jgi:hypothetical protein
MEFFGGGTEHWRVAKGRRTLNLRQETADPIVGALTLREARDRLRNGMRRIAELKRGREIRMEKKPYGMGWQRDLPDFRDYG